MGRVFAQLLVPCYQSQAERSMPKICCHLLCTPDTVGDRANKNAWVSKIAVRVAVFERHVPSNGDDSDKDNDDDNDARFGLEQEYAEVVGEGGCVHSTEALVRVERVD